MSSVLNFFSQSSMNNNERPDSAETGAGAEMEDAEMENVEMEFAAGMENTAGMEDSAQIEDVHMEDAVQMEGEGRDRIQHLLTNVGFCLYLPPPSELHLPCEHLQSEQNLPSQLCFPYQLQIPSQHFPSQHLPSQHLHLSLLSQVFHYYSYLIVKRNLKLRTLASLCCENKAFWF